MLVDPNRECTPAHIIKQLHRFCGECIHKCIRIGMKECPSCRKPIPSRRSLRRDTNFDKIVQNMVGTASQQQLEDEQYGKHQNDNNKMLHLQRAIQKKKNITERQRQRTTKLKRQQQQNHNGGDSASTMSLLGSLSSASQLPTRQNPGSSHGNNRHQLRLTNLEPSPLLELELRRHPNEVHVDRLDRGFLTVRADAKVSLLKTFLNQKLRMDTAYEITSNLDDDSVVLDDDMALMHAQETLCPNNERVMVLKYKTTTNGRPLEITTTKTQAVGKVGIDGDDGDMVHDIKKLAAASQKHSTTDGAGTRDTGIVGNYRDI
jgi:hypothetical protein